MPSGTVYTVTFLPEDMTLPSKSGGFQLPKIAAVSSQIEIDSHGNMYFDWALTQYIQNIAWRNEGRNGQNCLYARLYLFKKAVFCPIIPI